MDTNLNGVVTCTRAALPHMKVGGKIVCVSSAAAFEPMPFRTMYSVTKSAVNMFARAMTHEQNGTGIMITALCLGDVRTEFAACGTTRRDIYRGAVSPSPAPSFAAARTRSVIFPSNPSKISAVLR